MPRSSRTLTRGRCCGWGRGEAGRLAQRNRGRVSHPSSRFERLTLKSPRLCRGNFYRLDGQANGGLEGQGMGEPYVTKLTQISCRS